MADDAARLQMAIERLRTAVEWFKAPHAADPATALENLRRVREQLSVAGDVIFRARSQAGEDLRGAISHYRDCLQRLQEALPSLQSHLLRQRSRLQPEREQAEAAMQWISCSKSTLG